jgi:hypothetical protein
MAGVRRFAVCSVVLAVSGSLGAENRLFIEPRVLSVGETSASVPVLLHCDEPVTSFSLSLATDSSLLEITGIDFEGTGPAEPLWDAGQVLDGGSRIVWGAVPEKSIPAGDKIRIANLLVAVSARQPGSATIRFEDFPADPPLPEGKNMLVGEEGEPLSFTTSPGEIRIALGGSPFVRGDSNGDGKVDISDAVHLLGFLFLGASAPACPDAADADDDGTLNITDAIYSFAFLFQGGRGLPPPYPLRGADPTHDSLRCDLLVPTARAEDIQVLAEKLDFLRPIQPNLLDSELAMVPTNILVLGRLSATKWNRKQEVDPENPPALRWTLTPAPEGGPFPRLSEELLVHEHWTGALLSVDACANLGDQSCGNVKLHYNARGWDAEQSAQAGSSRGGIISTAVTPIHLQNGWLLAFDSGSKNIVALRKEEPGDVEYADGTRAVASFRPQAPAEPTKSKNFGRGDGLVMSLVISGEKVAQQLDLGFVPTVTRFVELEANKVLVLFLELRAVHLLELEEAMEMLEFDLEADPAGSRTVLPVELLRGSFKLFTSTPSPFLTYREIAEKITGDANIQLESFQPLLLPGTSEVLAFEQTSSVFVRILAKKDAPTGEIVGGDVALAVGSQELFQALESGAAPALAEPPFTFDDAFPLPGDREVALFEEKTNILLAHNYLSEGDGKVRVLLSAGDLLQRRGPDGVVVGDPTIEPSLVFARTDFPGGRLAFDRGPDQILSVSYDSPLVIVVAGSADLTGATGKVLVDLTYMEALDDFNLRTLDNQATALLSIGLQYVLMPAEVP